MTYHTTIMHRVEKLVQQARKDRRTVPMVRGYLNRAFEYARRQREPELMRFICEIEQSIGF